MSFLPTIKISISLVKKFIGQNIDSSIAAHKQLIPENLTRSRGSGCQRVSPTAARTPKT